MTLVALILLLVAVLIVFKIRKLSTQGYVTFLNLKQSLAVNFSNYEYFKQPFLTLLDKHAPYINTKIRANQIPYMT